MQTETIFRAARALDVITKTIKRTAPDIGFTFQSNAQELFVVATGRPVGGPADGPREFTLMTAMDQINEVAEDLIADDAFTLVFVSGAGDAVVGAAIFRVEAV